MNETTGAASSYATKCEYEYVIGVGTSRYATEAEHATEGEEGCNETFNCITDYLGMFHLNDTEVEIGEAAEMKKA